MNINRWKTFIRVTSPQQILLVGMFGVCMLVGIFARFSALGKVPLSLYWDEVAMLADARMLLETGADLHGRSWKQAIFVSYGDYKLPVYIWMTTLSAQLIGLTPLAARLPSALAGLATIIVAGWCAFCIIKVFTPNATRQFRILVAGSAAAIVAVTPWSIFFSRVGFEAHVSQSIAGLGLAVLLFAYTVRNSLTSRLIGVLLAGVLAVIAMYTYYSTRFVIVPVLATAVVLMQLQGNTSIKSQWKQLVLLTGALALIVLLGLQPMFRSPVYQASNQYRLSTQSLLTIEPFVLHSNEWRSLAGNSLLSRVFFHRRVLQAQTFFQNVAAHLSPDYLFLSGDQNIRHGTGQHGILLLSTAPLLAIGLIWLCIKGRKAALLLIVWWLLALVPASVPSEVPHALRSLNALLPIMILTGIGCAVVLEYSMRWKSNITSFLLVLVLCVGLLAETSRYLHYYFTAYPTLSAHAWQHGYAALAEVIGDWHPEHRVEIASSEYRLLLWIIALTDLDTNSIAEAFQREAPFPKQIGRIRVRELEPDTMWKAEKPVLVVGSSDLMQWYIKTATQPPHTVLEFSTADPEVQFTAAEYVEQ